MSWGLAGGEPAPSLSAANGKPGFHGGLFGTFRIGQHQAEYKALDGIEPVIAPIQIVVVPLKIASGVHSFV